ncbi:hypothetical protein AXG93_3509s1070 [Marchantia polymorpha subsp. ruderalis]|uniref:Uncharacterized protein n=1 Tax=Marchantia polymorpha subsp. ruderalis TaxID=1480154 RepID=A0A176VRN2_MARPO|nr:hypothetical protein AXG93_3509s1070 [Marchantia polymorpha subsp. ruderalis]
MAVSLMSGIHVGLNAQCARAASAPACQANADADAARKVSELRLGGFRLNKWQGLKCDGRARRDALLLPISSNSRRDSPRMIRAEAAQQEGDVAVRTQELTVEKPVESTEDDQVKGDRLNMSTLLSRSKAVAPYDVNSMPLGRTGDRTV